MYKLKINRNKIVLTGLVLLFSCGRPGSDVIERDHLPGIFPDYCGVTVPVNIAPLNFMLSDKTERSYIILEGKNGKIELSGKGKTNIPLRKWQNLLKKNQDDSLVVTVFAHQQKKWNRFKSFSIHIKKEPVDPWLVYRLIAPGYESWSEMGIYQRNLSTFKTNTIIDNRLLPGACMNCHSFSSNNPDKMLFHLRGSIGATMLIMDGSVSKLNTKTSETISNCVYPYWHPSGNYVAFSVNNISQVFHSVKEKRIEVLDSKSDLVVYDIASNRLFTSSVISSDKSLETFPVFTPDGNSLIFCSADTCKMPEDFSKVKYSLCRISFDPITGSFGKTVDTLVSSARTGKSVSFPRISPDGKQLIFTLSDYGNFSIWHREADLYRLNMSDGDFGPVTIINSNESESYHSWSSNSRWLVFSSRRNDVLYTRPFISYSDENGNFSKPFMIPQRDPDYYMLSLRSFNVPEFVTGKVKSDGRILLKSIGSTAKNVNFGPEN